MSLSMVILWSIVNLLLSPVQEKSPVMITPEKPLQGGKVTITYNPEYGKLKNPQNLILVYGNYATYMGKKEKMIKNGDIWQVSLPLNDERTSFIAFYFLDSTKYDDNKGKQFYFMIYKNIELPVENAHYYKSRFLRFLSVFDYSKYQQEVLSNTRKELEYYPFNKKAKKWLLSLLSPDEIIEARKNKEISDEDFKPVFPYSKAKHDSIYKENNDQRKITSETDEETKNILCEKFISEFPSSFGIDMIYRFLFYYNKKKSNIDKMLYMGENWVRTEKHRFSEAYNSLAWAMVEKGVSLDKALELSNKSLEVMDSDINIGGTIKIDSGSIVIANPDNYRNNITSRPRKTGMYLDTKGWIYYKKGDLSRAEELIRESFYAYPNSVEVAGHLIEIFEKAGKQDSILPVISMFLENNFGNKHGEEIFKKHYVKKYKDEKSYTEALKNIEIKYHERIKRNAVMEKMNRKNPEFTIKMDNGSFFSTIHEKGKVIFMNFYETLGGGFDFQRPYLDKIYKKFRDRKDFCFLAINNGRGKMETRERNENILKEKNIIFPTAYDENSTVSDLYSDLLFSYMSGYDEDNENRMPFKMQPPAFFIIDKAGKCQFSHYGINNADILFEQFEAQIEFLLNEK